MYRLNLTLTILNIILLSLIAVQVIAVWPAIKGVVSH